MGVTIQFESHRVELPFIYEAEHDSAVLEYYDQPPSIPLSYCAANGRRLSLMHTSDYFVLRDGSAGWIECKTEEDLEALARRSPNRYSRDDGKKWRCIPGENYAATVGLVYEVWSAAQVNWILHRNLQFLEDYLRLSSVTTADFVNPAILEESLKSKEPASVHHIAARLGYSNDGYIQQKFPDLCAAISRKIAKRKQAHFDVMRRTLERALGEDSAPTLTELSRRLGCTTSSTLRMHEPRLCDQILARYRTCIEERRSELRKAEESALGQTPVPSVRSVCTQLGVTVWFMNKYFPDVRRRISEQHRRCSLAETARRRKLLFDAVRDNAAEIHCRGLYPSAARIADRIPQGLRCQWMTLNAAVRQARTDLGISMSDQ